MSARSRNLWTLLGATAVALGLGLYAWLGVMKGDEREAEQKRVEERIVRPLPQPDGGTEVVRYDSLTVQAKGDTTELQRLADQSWVITRPLRLAADTRAADDLVGSLQYARLSRTVEDHPTAEELQRYGLDKPAVEVTASAGGVNPTTVKLGLENAYNNTVYMQRSGDPKVYAVDVVSRKSLEQSTFDLRDKEVLGVPEPGLTRVELKSRKHAWTLARDPGQPFVFVRPEKEAADTAAVSGWLGALRAQKATRFLEDSPAERKRTGVEKPEVDVTYQRGTTETVRVRVATGKPEGAPAYVLREDAFGVSLAEVPTAALAALDKSRAELRDRAVLHVDPQAVARIRFRSGNPGAELVVERDRPTDGGPETWRLTAPVRAPADPFRLGSLLYSLTSLRAEATEEPMPTDPSRTGLGPAARAVVLEGTDGKALATLTLGKDSSKPAGTFVCDDRGRVGVVQTSRLKELPARAEDLQAPGPPTAVDAGSAG